MSSKCYPEEFKIEAVNSFAAAQAAYGGWQSAQSAADKMRTSYGRWMPTERTRGMRTSQDFDFSFCLACRVLQ